MHANGEQQHNDLEENINRVSVAEHSVLPSILTRPKGEQVPRGAAYTARLQRATDGDSTDVPVIVDLGRQLTRDPKMYYFLT
jgi:hypothetical protein